MTEQIDPGAGFAPLDTIDPRTWCQPDPAYGTYLDGVFARHRATGARFAEAFYLAVVGLPDNEVGRVGYYVGLAMAGLAIDHAAEQMHGRGGISEWVLMLSARAVAREAFDQRFAELMQVADREGERRPLAVDR